MNVGYSVALVGGIMSFFTPCILPLLPVYFGYLAGEAVNDLDNEKINKKLLINAFGFVLGLTTLNILLGFGVTALGNTFSSGGDLFRIIGGVLVILFGFYFIFDFKLAFLEKESKVEYKNYAPTFFKSFVLGVAFNFGWTPCNGPIIGTILAIATFQHDYAKAGLLMLVYSLGFSVLFLLSALLIGIFLKKVRGIYKHFRMIKIVSGVLMVIVGLLMIFNKLQFLNVI